MKETQTFDLGVAVSWEFDEEFSSVIESTAHRRGMCLYQIRQNNIEETMTALRNQLLQFRCLLDRASDEDESFLPLARFLTHQHRCRIINPHDLVTRAADKATMHLELIAHGIETPYTIIISPYNHKREVELSLSELAQLGRPFIIKPANTTGGGIGVVTGAETLKDILEARQHHKNDKYLLQETIRPAYLSEDRGWFRIFYAFGEIIPCWWDDVTHAYESVSPQQESTFGLGQLSEITARIYQICRLDFFSTEIAFTTRGRFVVVDYVNELCDMRLQSKHPDGVPDEVVQRIANQMLSFVQSLPLP